MGCVQSKNKLKPEPPYMKYIEMDLQDSDVTCPIYPSQDARGCVSYFEPHQSLQH